jgi:hypothetical protein
LAYLKNEGPAAISERAVQEGEITSERERKRVRKEEKRITIDFTEKRNLMRKKILETEVQISWKITTRKLTFFAMAAAEGEGSSLLPQRANSWAYDPPLADRITLRADSGEIFGERKKRGERDGWMMLNMLMKKLMMFDGGGSVVCAVRG